MELEKLPMYALWWVSSFWKSFLERTHPSGWDFLGDLQQLFDL